MLQVCGSGTVPCDKARTHTLHDDLSAVPKGVFGDSISFGQVHDAKNIYIMVDVASKY